MQFGEALKDLEWLSPDTVIYQNCKVRLTPMIEQYLDAKKENPDDVLLFRMGDFYEAFFHDAVILHKELDLALTSRNKKDGEDQVPMAGVPHRNIDEYAMTLVDRGYRVAICDQLEDPSQAVGIVRRGVTKVLTPGTFIDPRPGNEREFRTLCAVKFAQEPAYASLACVDFSTAYTTVSQVSDESSFFAECKRMNVREILIHGEIGESLRKFAEHHRIAIHVVDANRYKVDFFLNYAKKFEENSLSTNDLKRFFDGIDKNTAFSAPSLIASSLAALFCYILETQKKISANFLELHSHVVRDFLEIDASTLQNLEIFETMRGAQKYGSLYGSLDETKTPQGSRLLKRTLSYPLKNIDNIRKRHDCVAYFVSNVAQRQQLRELLTTCCDLQRLAARLVNAKAPPKDLDILRKNLRMIPTFVKILRETRVEPLGEIANRFKNCDALAEKLEAALCENPPASTSEGTIIKSGYDVELDKIRAVADKGKAWILEYEAEQKQKTGINSLKIKYQRIFGYFIEITKSNLSMVPENYIRKQTLSNAERFYTPELKEYEETLLTAEDSKSTLEMRIFEELRDYATTFVPDITRNAEQFALVDLLTTFAHIAHERQYTCPVLTENCELRLLNARHPVVEQFLPRSTRFVPGDLDMNENDARTIIITGPNMSGKSTIIRQAAIITLLAHTGSFVPAESAVVGLTDRIFSRVGASDNLALGQSTFMVEMSETANILRHAGPQSLIILDEIGRGTSTYDGLALAWSIAEYLHVKIRARVLFATHYHELTELESTHEGIINASVAVKEYAGDIIFLRKLLRGAANRSYGIQVAKLAGIPSEVIARAEILLDNLEAHAHDDAGRPSIVVGHATQEKAVKRQNQGLLFGLPPTAPQNVSKDMALTEQITDDIAHLTLDATTPLQALNLLYKWQKKLKR